MHDLVDLVVVLSVVGFENTLEADFLVGKLGKELVIVLGEVSRIRHFIYRKELVIETV